MSSKSSRRIIAAFASYLPGTLTEGGPPNGVQSVALGAFRIEDCDSLRGRLVSEIYNAVTWFQMRITNQCSPHRERKTLSLTRASSCIC